MNTATKISELPALTADLLQSNGCLVDNLFADLWKEMGMKSLLNKAGCGSRLSKWLFIKNFIGFVKSKLLSIKTIN